MLRTLAISLTLLFSPVLNSCEKTREETTVPDNSQEEQQEQEQEQDQQVESAGKTIGLIVSSYSSGISSVVADAKRLIPEGKFVKESLWINNSNRSKKDELIKNWLYFLL